jgi:cyanophycinase
VGSEVTVTHVYTYVATETTVRTETTGVASPIVPLGTLVIMGGRTPEEGLREVLRATGKKRPRVGVIPTASGDPIAIGMDYVRLLGDLGAEAVLVEITEANCGTTAYDPAVVELIRSLDAVFFTGGDQNRVSRCFLPGVRPTPALQALWELFIRGGVISGNSAGAAIMSDPMIGGGMDEGVEITRGLGFLLPGRVIVDQHFLARGRFLRLLEAMIATGVGTGVGIDEDAAVVCTGGGRCRVIGTAPVVLVRLLDFNGTRYRFRLDYLAAGDWFDLESGEVGVAQGRRLVASGALPGGPATSAEDVEVKTREGLARAIDRLVASSSVTLRSVSESRRVTYTLTLVRVVGTSIYETGYFGFLRYVATGVTLYLFKS